jgi:hypothetical protein
VNPVHSKMLVNRKLRSRETRLSILDAKTVPNACKIGRSLPNITLPVTSKEHGKKGRIDLENLEIICLNRFVTSNRSDGFGNPIRVSGSKDRNRMGSEDLCSRETDRTVPR